MIGIDMANERDITVMNFYGELRTALKVFVVASNEETKERLLNEVQQVQFSTSVEIKSMTADCHEGTRSDIVFVDSNDKQAINIANDMTTLSRVQEQYRVIKIDIK